MRRTIAAVALLALLAGCTAPVQTDAPEPTPSDIVNGTATKVIRMPDGFRNVAVTCLGTTGIYVTSRGWVEASVDKNVTPLGSSIAVLANDPHCS